jgi:pimeloyl-ACP methyl ester carboxylesterase
LLPYLKGHQIVTDHEISFASRSLRLAASLMLPDADGPFPGVLLISGSGRVDRDENAKNLRINAMREIAVHLAKHDIASLRYDKCGVRASQGDFWKTGFHDNVMDAAAALDCLKSYHRIRSDRVFILGHSEGALIATRLGADGAAVTGLILLAGAASSGEEILAWQTVQIHKDIRGFKRWLLQALHIDASRMQKRLFDKIRHSDKDRLRALGIIKVNAKWLREFLTYHPDTDLTKIRVPLLAVTGTKDIQVSPADLARIAALTQGECEYHALPDMTHLLRTEPGTPSLATYKRQVTQPVDTRLLNIVVQWLRRKLPA